jgi:riboflavin kinase
MELGSNRILHFPDLVFVKWCEEKFGVNRGIYNTIDSWFYEKGLSDIVRRRQCILHFLYNNAQNSFKGEKIKFGHGGLTTCLSSYWATRLDKVAD